MHTTADHIRCKLASLEVNLQGFVGLQADTVSAAAHSFAMQWEMIKRSFRAQIKNCHLALQQDKGEVLTLRDLPVLEDGRVPEVQGSICTLAVPR